MTRRFVVLASPVFTGAVAVLAINDHLLKGMWPGLLTGKLSDAAGVVVVAIALSVLLGRSAGVGLAAAGFVALKTVPGVNVLAAPLLGGVTMADATDLVALLALVPTFSWLGRSLSQDSRPREPGAGRPVGVFGGLALVAAVLATSATSCMADEGVTLLAVDGDRVFAGITAYPELAHYELSDREPYWMVSDDGGLSWSPGGGDAPEDDAIVGADRTCRADGCWEVVPGEQVQFCPTEGSCAVSFQFTDAESERMVDQDTCLTKRYDEFNSVAALPGADGNVVVAMGTEGVLVSTGDGDWQRQAVGHLAPTPIGIAPTWIEGLAFVAPFALIVASPLVLLVRLWRRGTMIWIGFIIAAAGGVGLAFLAVALAFIEVRYDLKGLMIAGAAVGLFVASLVVARRPWQSGGQEIGSSR